MSKKIKLTESELVNLVKKIVSEQSLTPEAEGMEPQNKSTQKSIPFESLYEFMSNEYHQKNNKGIKVTLTFDGKYVVADLKGVKYDITIG